jgi:threonine/homoserine/homoserine lactone efflux protein
MTLLKLFLFLLTSFLAADLIAWLTKHQTMSQWIIAEAQRNRWFRFLMIVLLMLAAVFLCFHFELV